MRRALHRSALALLLWLLASPTVQALNCRVMATPLDFGVYTPGSALPLDTAGELSIDCRGNTGLFFVSLSGGNSGNATDRYMQLLGELLRYNVYLDAARVLIWGDGSGLTAQMTGVKLRTGREVKTVNFYGRVFAGQEPRSGNYADNLVVTVLF